MTNSTWSSSRWRSRRTTRATGWTPARRLARLPTSEHRRQRMRSGLYSRLFVMLTICGVQSWWRWWPQESPTSEHRRQRMRSGYLEVCNWWWWWHWKWEGRTIMMIWEKSCLMTRMSMWPLLYGKVAELEVKARQLEIELDLTIEKFGTVGIFFARHLVITIRNKFSRLVMMSQCYNEEIFFCNMFKSQNIQWSR